ncbi:MAG TPA: hypothetical protein V6C78_27925 [Crinalium sp.]|jgi:hypothetical protein
MSNYLSAKKLGNLLCAVVVCISFILSFRAFAAHLSPNLNSDHAIHILMAYDLKLPDDLYYWGQSRLGSIVPILGHILFKLFPISPAIAVACVQYFLLLVGYLCFASLLNHPVSRLILAIAWFLPLRNILGLLRIGQPYAGQLAFIGIAFVLLDRLIRYPEKFTGAKRQTILALSVASLFLGYWVSDFTIITILILAGFGFRTVYLKIIERSPTATFSWKAAILQPDVITVLTVSLAGVLFTRYAKSVALQEVSQFGFSSLSHFGDTISRLSLSFFRTLTFQAISVFQTFFAILITAVILYLIHSGIRESRFKTLATFNWLNVFLISAVCGFLILIWSDWVYRNNLDFRYFVPIYIYGWMAVLLWVENLQPATARRLGIVLVCAVVASSLSLPGYVFSIKPHGSQIKRLQPIAALGSIGIIGDYWSSYILCSVNPAQLSCTPYDSQGEFSCPVNALSSDLKRTRRVRCPRCVRRVFNSETIYLVKERWLDASPQPIDFPAETEQFGQCLVKVGEPIKRSGYTLAPYKRRAVAP